MAFLGNDLLYFIHLVANQLYMYNCYMHRQIFIRSVRFENITEIVYYFSLLLIYVYSVIILC